MTQPSKTIGIMGLLTASFFWGAEFVVEKDVLSVMGANYSNAIRFLAASILCTLFMRKKLKTITRGDLHCGVISGSFTGLGFAFQTMGLGYIEAGVNALLCSSYILIIPLAEWLLFRKNPGYRIFLYAFIAVIGIGFISYDASAQTWAFSVGEILTFLGALFYTGAIISIERFSSQTDSQVMSLLQFYVITIISTVFALMLEPIPRMVSCLVFIEFLYLIFFATIGAQLLMNHCIQFVSSSAAGLIFSSEALFAAILGILILEEPSTPSLWIGILLIVGAIALHQSGFPKKKSYSAKK
ncbi:DMT family transporter [Anoxybacterium hadale]|uniref:DMT family transporter n=1 Tax=Anoxybacterium hadale TaxID=3408580 RepID=A0ACD1AEY5_9FIRM|nr:DMT family transporter [Clostridiales bacterium]